MWCTVSFYRRVFKLLSRAVFPSSELATGVILAVKTVYNALRLPLPHVFLIFQCFQAAAMPWVGRGGQSKRTRAMISASRTNFLA